MKLAWIVLDSIFCTSLLILFFKYRLSIVRVISVVDADYDQTQIPMEACPFCGKNKADLLKETIKNDDGTTSEFYAICCNADIGGCGAATGFFEKPITAIKAWNDRHYE